MGGPISKSGGTKEKVAILLRAEKPHGETVEPTKILSSYKVFTYSM